MPRIPAPGRNPGVGRQSSVSRQWWVVLTPQTGRASNLLPPTPSVVQSATKPKNAIAGPFLSQSAADTWSSSTFQGGHLDLNPLNWLSDIGGKIASGLEAGFITGLKDLWNVIIGPLEVIIGVIIAMFVLGLYFKNDVISFISMAGTMAVK